MILIYYFQLKRNRKKQVFANGKKYFSYVVYINNQHICKVLTQIEKIWKKGKTLEKKNIFPSKICQK